MKEFNTKFPHCDQPSWGMHEGEIHMNDWFGDGICDSVANRMECGFDSGDCIG